MNKQSGISQLIQDVLKEDELKARLMALKKGQATWSKSINSSFCMPC